MSNQWVTELPQKVPNFLKKLQASHSGFFHYSLTGDYLPSYLHWGLGNTVFATKILYILELLKPSQTETKPISDYILSFQSSKGDFSDPYIGFLSLPMRAASAVRSLNPANLSYLKTSRAETRQSLSALQLLEVQPAIAPQVSVNSNQDVDQYFQSLNWHKPWDAGSHISHLLFFLNSSRLANKPTLINHILSKVSNLQQPDGSWYQGQPSLQQKINGAMKIITGFNAINQMDISKPQALIDLCLTAKNDQQACDNFNIIYVLKHASQTLNHTYRFTEIQSFAQERLDLYQQYYWPEHGGFSFHKGHANRLYYGAPITRGKPEPDIHGTVMFIWGISMIAQLIDLPIKLNEHQP